MSGFDSHAFKVAALFASSHDDLWYPQTMNEKSEASRSGMSRLEAPLNRMRPDLS